MRYRPKVVQEVVEAVQLDTGIKLMGEGGLYTEGKPGDWVVFKSTGVIILTNPEFHDRYEREDIILHRHHSPHPSFWNY